MFNLERYQFLKAVECDLEHTQTHICITVHNLYPQKLSSQIQDSSDPSHFIFEVNVGKSRIRHKKINLNDVICNVF